MTPSSASTNFAHGMADGPISRSRKRCRAEHADRKDQNRKAQDDVEEPASKKIHVGMLRLEPDKKGSKTKSYRFDLSDVALERLFRCTVAHSAGGAIGPSSTTFVEALQKGLTRGAQGRDLGVDHDVVEEAVDRAAKNGKCREHLPRFAGRRSGPKGLGFDVVDGGEELLFSVFGKEVVDDCWDFASIFLRMLPMRLLAAVRASASGSAHQGADSGEALQARRAFPDSGRGRRPLRAWCSRHRGA